MLIVQIILNDSQIRASNPWWEARENIERDEKIVKWKESIQYDPRPRHKITYDFEPDNTVVYTLRGPRQVGKTTLIKLQIRDFLKQRVCPWNIFYYSFDLVNSNLELVEIIESYLRLSKKYRKPTRTYLFLDEITSVNDWQKGIKWLVDSNKLKHCTLLATGSQAANILHAAERLPGRKGMTKDPYHNLLIPMKFSEFVEIHDKEIARFMKEQQLCKTEDRKKAFLQLVSKETPKKIDLLHIKFIDDLDNYLYEYMLTGGTPRIVDVKSKTNRIPSELYTDYLDGIKSDWGQLKSETLLKQFGSAGINSLSTRTSWNNLQKQADLGSGATAQNYAFSLNDLSIINIIHQYGEKRKMPLFTRQKKIYFQDPFYLHMFNSSSSKKNPFTRSEEFLADNINQSKVIEGIVSNHLIRWAFSLAENKQGFDYFYSVFFWQDQKKREVDFVLYNGDSFELPIEVKYRNKLDPRELGGLTSFLDETGVETGLVLSKCELDERRDYLIIPTCILLMLI